MRMPLHTSVFKTLKLKIALWASRAMRVMLDVRIESNTFLFDLSLPFTVGKPLYIEPGSHWENGYMEAFKVKMRDELPAGVF
jgi:hypothetical protein